MTRRFDVHPWGSQWMLNNNDKDWLVTLMNPAGALRPQQGLFPTDCRENRKVVIRTKVPVATASDWLAPDEEIKVQGNGNEAAIELTVLAGSVRIVELKGK